MVARLHRSISVSHNQNSAENLTAATRLHLLSNKPLSVQIDTIVKILGACIARGLAPKETGHGSRLCLGA